MPPLNVPLYVPLDVPLGLRLALAMQDQVLTRAQCAAAGLTRAQIRSRLASGRWLRLAAGVYLARRGPATAAQRRVGVLLAVSEVAPVRVADLPAWEGSPPAALWGESAAAAWGLSLARAPATVQVVVPVGRDVVCPDGATIKRVRKWKGLVDETTFPWRTSRAATVIDCASLGSEDDALSWLTRGVREGFVTSEALAAELVRRQRVRHGQLMREVLGDVAGGAHSAAEVRYVRDVERGHGLPEARRQVPSRANGTSVHDNDYGVFGLVIEVDGRLGHEHWEDRIRDGRRDRQLAGADGKWTSRVFWPDVAVSPCATAREVAQLLTARGWTGRPTACRRPDCGLRLSA